MKLLKFPEKDSYSKKPKVIALGKFESFHLGHRKIFENARKIADVCKKELVFMIFDERESNNLFSLNERIMFLQKYKPDYIMVFERKKDNFKITREEFEEFLININVSDVVCGGDFRYGFNREGNINNLSNRFNLKVIKNFYVGDKKASTTELFESINNDLTSYAKMMDQYFFYNGRVVRGLGNGKKFGMPTANVEYPSYKVDIDDGIYYSYVIYKGKRMPSLTSISYNPTLKATNKTYETYIYNFDEDIYDEYIYVELILKYRDPIKFDSVDELIKKLDEDKKLGKDFFDI